MKKKKILTTIIAIFLVTGASFAQDKKEGHHEKNKEKIKTLKIAHISSKLELTSEEAQKFWPVYNEFENKREELHQQKRATRKSSKKTVNPTDSEIEKNINTCFSIKQQELNLEKEYHSKFKAVLPIRKVDKLYKAQEDFKRNLLKKMRTHKGDKGGESSNPPPRGPRKN